MVPADYTSELAQRLGYQGRADRRPASPLPIRTFIPPYTRNLSSRLPRLQTPDRVHARRAHTEGSGEGGTQVCACIVLVVVVEARRLAEEPG